MRHLSLRFLAVFLLISCAGNDPAGFTHAWTPAPAPLGAVPATFAIVGLFPPLWEPDATIEEAYRVVWNGAFDGAFEVRIVRDAKGNLWGNRSVADFPILHHLYMAAYLPHGNATRRLSHAEWDTAVATLTAAGLWALPEMEQPGGLDGSILALEGYQRGKRYHGVSCWSSTCAAFRAPSRAF